MHNPRAQSITRGSNTVTVQNRQNRAYSISAKSAEAVARIVDSAETDACYVAGSLPLRLLSEARHRSWCSVQQWIDGWPGLVGTSPKPRGFPRSAHTPRGSD